MVKWALLIVFSFFLSLGTYLYFHLGVYHPVQLEVQERGPFVLLYKTHLGPYFKINKSIEEIESWAKLQKLDCSVTFGEYLDDPQSADEDRLRSHAGCILNQKPEIALPDGYSLEERPVGRFVIGQFSGSLAVGPYTVYPKAYEFISQQRLKQNGPVIEVYRLREGRIDTEFLFPILSH